MSEDVEDFLLIQAKLFVSLSKYVPEHQKQRFTHYYITQHAQYLRMLFDWIEDHQGE